MQNTYTLAGRRGRKIREFKQINEGNERKKNTFGVDRKFRQERVNNTLHFHLSESETEKRWKKTNKKQTKLLIDARTGGGINERNDQQRKHTRKKKKKKPGGGKHTHARRRSRLK